MKKVIVLLSVLMLTSCGSASRTMFGTTEKNLINTVSIEQNCPAEKIEILQKEKGLHGATYALNVCGNRVVYKQIGSVFMESSKADATVKSIQGN
jgi:uncharacterized protein YcfL